MFQLWHVVSTELKTFDNLITAVYTMISTLSSDQYFPSGAFTRGLKDPFPPARMAAVLALSATQQFYALIEVR